MALNRREKEKQQARKSDARAWADKKDVRFEPTAIRLPDGVSTWKPSKEGIYKIDVIPYIAGKNNPNADAGMEHFERTYHVHRIPAPNGRSLWYCCTSECFSKGCFVCKWMNQNGGSADPDLLSKLRAQKRLLMNVLDVTTRESKEQGIQILDQAFGTEKHPSFGQVLKNKIRSVEEYGDFANLEGGYTLHCTVQEGSWPGGKFMQIVNVEMVRRKHDYPLDILKKAICLDKCLIEQTEETMRQAILQETADEEADEKTEADDPEIEAEDAEEGPETAVGKPRGAGRSHTQEAELNLKVGDWVMYKGETMTIQRISGDGTSLTLEDNDEAVYKLVAVDKVKKVKTKEDEDGPGARQLPARKGVKLVRAVDEEEEEDLDSADEEEEEEFDSDEDEEEDDFEDLEEEEEEPVAKKKAAKNRGLGQSKDF